MNLPSGHPLQNGKYKLTHVVGQGGFGITYKGVWFTEVKGPLGTVKTEVPICVKEYFFKDYCYRDPYSQTVRVHSETGKVLFNKFKEKLIKEAKILSEVHHPYIVNVLEVFEENHTAYIAMEYISGFSLKSLLEKRGVLPEATALRYVRQIGEALQFVHEKDILHLDIKPSNILIDKNGNARLIDFGVSKRYDTEQEETNTTMLTLSKGFASIEQYDNEGIQVFSPRPDIYSLGATMYNLLTGKIPTESILRATRPLRKPSEINPSITLQTEAVILKAMQIVPADRYTSVKEMMAALDFSQVREETPPPSDLPPEVEEETTLISAARKIEEAEEEETLAQVPPSSADSKPEAEKKKSKGWRVSVGMAIFALLGSAIALWLYRDSKEEATGGIELPPAARMDSLIAESDSANADKMEMPPMPEETQTVETPAPQPEEVLPVVERQPVAIEPIETEASAVSDSLSASEREERYERLLLFAQEKMAKADYVGAKEDLSAARDAKLTEEVVRLMITCDEKAEEQRIADRLAQYEEKMAFGKYKIVRKKSSNRYGAIDTEGEERIPCKYLSVGLAENGRAFEREDNLFDIYDAEGTLVSEGLTYY